MFRLTLEVHSHAQPACRVSRRKITGNIMKKKEICINKIQVPAMVNMLINSDKIVPEGKGVAETLMI